MNNTGTSLANTLKEKSKNDKAIIVGSEIRAALQELEQQATQANDEIKQLQEWYDELFNELEDKQCELEDANDEIKQLREALENIEMELKVKEILLMTGEEITEAFAKSCKEEGKDAKEEIQKLRAIIKTALKKVDG